MNRWWNKSAGCASSCSSAGPEPARGARSSSDVSTLCGVYAWATRSSWGCAAFCDGACAESNRTRTYYLSILKRKKEERRPEEDHRACLCLARKLRILSPPRDLAQHSCGNQHMVAPSPEPGGSKDIYRCRPRVSWEVISTWEDHSSVHSVTLLAQLVRASAARKPWAFAISAAAKVASGDSRRNTRSPSPYRRHRYR